MVVDPKPSFVWRNMKKLLKLFKTYANAPEEIERLTEELEDQRRQTEQYSELALLWRNRYWDLKDNGKVSKGDL